MEQSSESDKHSLQSERIINIALVGHVANGKTTLVEALTGTNTKRSSTEKQTGRTIKLGYANCTIWQCIECSKVFSSKDPAKCPNCNIPAQKKVTISFVDAPGHHSYIHTMVKGVTVVDGAILVTDVRREPMQVQTLEHLAILSILDVKNIIVVQNKADLVNQQRCLEHYKELKKELRGTAAENSPIIPVSAQQNINIDILLQTLLELTQHVELVSNSTGVFQIIRSFDINKPGTDILDIKGGVLGGTVVGMAKYKVGDQVEIRPGFIDQNGCCTPLETQIVSIFAENEPKAETTIGGLYGLGTKLDPCLTMADRLSGNLLGKKEELPEIIKQIEMRVVSVQMDRGKQKVKPDQLYKLIIGNVVVQAVAAESVKKNHIVMQLLRPICTMETRCLIYQVESSNTQLIAFGKFGCQPAQSAQPANLNQPAKLIQPANLNQPDYLSMIQEFNFVKSTLKIPIVKIGRENRNIIWHNIQAFSIAIHRTPSEIGKYLAEETMLEIVECSDGLRLYKTNINAIKIESVMRSYIKQILCKQCGGITQDMICISCNACVRDLRE